MYKHFRNVIYLYGIVNNQSYGLTEGSCDALPLGYWAWIGLVVKMSALLRIFDE